MSDLEQHTIKSFNAKIENDCFTDPIIPHHHDYFELYLILDGKTDYCIDGKVTSLTRGDIMLISPGEVHNVVTKSEQPFKRLIIGISPRFLSDISTKETDLAMCFKAAEFEGRNVISANDEFFNEILSFAMKIIEKEPTKFGEDILNNVYLQTILVSINRLYLETNEVDTQKNASLINEISKYITEHIAEDLKIETIAFDFGISKFHLAHLFKNETGSTLHQYILQKRLALSKKYILDGIQITEVYEKCGFKDYSNFFRSFKDMFGITPKTFYKNSKQRK